MANGIEYIPKSNSAKQNNRFKWISAALLVVVIILIILIGFLSLYVDLNGRSTCTTKECLQTTAALKSSMDYSYSPCDNFYKFVCNKFEEVNLGHPEPLSEYSNFDRITNRLNHLIQKFLEVPARKNDPPPIKMVKDFYAACNDRKKREELGYFVMDKYLLQAGLPKVPTIFTLPVDKWHTYTFNWVKTAVAMKKTFGIDLFVDIMCDKRKIYIVAEPQPPNIPQLLDYEDIALLAKFKTRFNTLKDDFKRMVMHVISEVLADERTGKDYKTILNKTSDVIWNMTIEVHFAKNLVGGEQSYASRKDELRNISLANLQNLTETMLTEGDLAVLREGQDWKTYITMLFGEITGNKTANFTENDVVYYYEKELPYIISTPVLVAKTPDIMLEMYAWWNAVFLMIGSTTNEIAETSSTLLYSDSESLESCIDITTEHFNSAIGYGAITDSFLTEIKPQVEELVENVRDSLMERLRAIKWIDDATREVAIKKLRALEVFVGAPNWISNETYVMNEYSRLSIRNDSHLDNLMQIIQFDVADSFKAYFQNINGSGDYIYYGKATEVNAFYNPLRSSITIPWSILNAPVYHLGLASMNYGALGTLIGHEIIHGFDELGRLYDDESNFRNWWTPQSLVNFEEKSKCFIQQYENFAIRIFTKYYKVNGTNTLSENMADNGGVRIAYRAFQRHLKNAGPEHLLPGLSDFTSEQLFFLSYGHYWCFAEGTNAEQLMNQLDEHAPHDVRVNAVAQNSPEFAEAFNCPIGSKMNPNRKRCDMW